MKKNDKNEYIGIAAIIIIVLLGIGALYFHYTHRTPTPSDNLNIPIEANLVDEGDHPGVSK